jgi:hypothetical protein
MQHHFHNEHFTLEQWREVWLERACHNRLEPIWDCTCQLKQANLKIIQTPLQEVNPTLRMHAIKIGLFKEDYSVEVKDVLILPET